MTRYFCTLFDSNYFYRGLSLYNSLIKNCPDFVLWILCMDNILYDQLSNMNLDRVRLIKLSEFEDDELLAIKDDRTVGEYCWTISSSLPLYIFDKNSDIDSVTYLDSDLYFFSDPSTIYDEIGDDSIAIVRHNYSKELSYLEERSGIYNVSMVYIKRNEEGMKCLQWWRKKCIEWCYAYYEDGKLGDQMYLDDWTERFKGVCVLKNKGANLAPWNINKYMIREKNNSIYVDEDKLVFYHYHSLKIYGYNKFHKYYSSYLILPQDEKMLYTPYTKEVNALIKTMESDYPDFKVGLDNKPSLKFYIKSFLKKKLIILFYLFSITKLKKYENTQNKS